MDDADRPPLPPFTMDTAAQKVRLAEDAWNGRDPGRVALAYTVDSRWRNRTEFIEGRAAIEALLRRKWDRALDYRLTKELWGFRENRMAVRFAYEWHDDSGHWFRYPRRRSTHPASAPSPALIATPASASSTRAANMRGTCRRNPASWIV